MFMIVGPMQRVEVRVSVFTGKTVDNAEVLAGLVGFFLCVPPS